jgi:hypothetical protein
MSSQGSIYGIIEMNRRIEMTCQNVKRELLRIGCPPERIGVMRRGANLQINHQQQSITVPAQEVLGFLKNVPTGTDYSTVWKQVYENEQLLEEQRIGPNGVGVAIIGGFVFLAFLTFVFKII